jgi:protein TonB
MLYHTAAESLWERRFVMLAYAASRRIIGQRQFSPHALMIVIAAHIALVAVVMSAKMDLPQRIRDHIIRIDLYPLPKTPPPKPITQPHQQPLVPPISNPRNVVPLSHPDPIPVDPGPTVGPGSAVDSGTVGPPQIAFNLIPLPVHHDARLLTPASELRPPYPPSKLLSEEEATLRLKLTISNDGRVVAVDPVGAADREFLDAARRYLVAHWRYQPATDDGRAVLSSTVITLRFQLDG